MELLPAVEPAPQPEAAQAAPALPAQVVDVPTRPGVTQRLLVLRPAQPRAAVVLLAGGHGGLQIQGDGTLKWGGGNFLVRTRQQFAAQDLLVAVLDAPSDRQRQPFLSGFRQTPEHLADLKAVIAWLRAGTGLPVWLVGTSRGTQSAAYAATELTGPAGPDGVVLSATILRDPRSRAVPALPLQAIRVPVLVVHHERDGCPLCAYADLPLLTERLTAAPRSALLPVRGGQDVGDPCEAQAHHGFNGVETPVVRQTAAWMLAR
ncbi:MAG: alpha/beta hydrolase [Rhodoferax sp.]|nr:alpha/beta hydrolase [Rhodoferax sp.]